MKIQEIFFLENKSTIIIVDKKEFNDIPNGKYKIYLNGGLYCKIDTLRSNILVNKSKNLDKLPLEIDYSLLNDLKGIDLEQNKLELLVVEGDNKIDSENIKTTEM